MPQRTSTPIGRRVARAWRALRTGVAFVSFGAISFTLLGTAVPWFRLTVADPQERELRVQGVVNRAYRRFLGLMSGLGLMRFRATGVERLAAPGVLVVANHPTLIDVIAILGHMPPATCITKQANATNPFMRGIIRAAGYVPIVGGGQAVVDTCVDRLRGGRRLLMFPEGTRSPAGALGPFHRGAAHIALASGRDLLPVTLDCDPPTLMRGQPWYDVPDRPFAFSVRVGEPIAVSPYLDALEAGESRGRVARRLTAELREVFEKELRGGLA